MRRTITKLDLAFVLVVVGVLNLLGRGFPPRAHAQDNGSGVKPLGHLWNTVAPAISANLFATNLTPSTKTSLIRIGFTPKVTGVLYLVETNGTTTQVYALNDGNACTAFHAYGWDWPISGTDGASPASPLQYNFQLGTNAGVGTLRVQEVLGNAD